MSEPTPELRELRTEIAEIDRAVLEALNRRLELVMRVREHKQDAGTRFVDAEREAELLGELAALNHGPLSDRAVRSLFSAVLDVMKQETAEEPRRAAPAAGAPASLGIERLAVVGTGLVGTSVALAAKRAGVKTVSGFDADAATLREAAARGAFDTQAASLADALGGAELVVVAVPVGAAVEMTRAALAAAGPDATVTDVASTKRALAAAIDDPRFVPGHPVAGGETGGPARAAADLFDGATWFVTPTASTDAARLAGVERFATALGARPVRQDADEHDRLLALTSHLPHALANLLIGRVAAAAAGNEAPLEHAGASLRDMTRIAGANPAVWIDIFVENGDLIADALAAYGADLEDVERALRDGDRVLLRAHDRRRGRDAQPHARPRVPHRGDADQPDPHPRPRPARRSRADHADPRSRRDQHRGLRAPPRLAGVRRRPRHPRQRQRPGQPRPRAAPPRRVRRRLRKTAPPPSPVFPGDVRTKGANGCEIGEFGWFSR